FRESTTPIERAMRENWLGFGMVDVEWLRVPSKSHKRIPVHIERRFPIANNKILVEAFAKIDRKYVTIITCPNQSEASVAIPFLVGSLSAEYDENFKMIIALKRHTQYTIDILNELIVSSEGLSPIKHRQNDRDKNLVIATFHKVHNYVDEALGLSDSQLTHLVIEGFDGDNCLDLELLSLALQLSQTQKGEKLRVIVLTDGLEHEAKGRVQKISQGISPIQCVNLLSTEKNRPDRYLPLSF
ncbi:hypothetical protein PMAYCL1PPCAC_06879, partial [Pristionchus mayeri]